MTERMRAEQALRESQRRWATAVESAGLGTWESDLATKVSWRSPVHARIFGYDDPRPDWSLERFLAHVVPEERDPVRRGIEESLERREPWTVKCRIRRRDGAIRWVWVHGSHIETDTGGAPTRAFGLVQDVTDEEEVAAAVRDAERRHRQVLDVIPQLIWSCEPGGRCDYLSRQWAQYTGVPAEDQLGYGWLERLHPDDRGPTMEAWSRTVDSGGMFDTRFRIQGADGTYRWFRTRGVPLRDASGDIVKWFGTNTDVDDQIRAEAALLEADRRKNEFLAVLSHELRNPLAPIKNSLFVLDHAADAEQARQARAIIERQVSQLASLVDDLLDITRITQEQDPPPAPAARAERDRAPHARGPPLDVRGPRGRRWKSRRAPNRSSCSPTPRASPRWWATSSRTRPSSRRRAGGRASRWPRRTAARRCGCPTRASACGPRRWRGCSSRSCRPTPTSTAARAASASVSPS